MSSSGDVCAMENSLNDNLGDASTVYFNDKNYVFITDSTSNSGSFSAGQIQFDLSTLNSQSQWINLPEGVVEFPVKITCTVDTAGTGSVTTISSAAISSAIIKNGWHHFIDSAQLIIDGQTIQSSQPYENVAATFRILSSWSQDTLKKWGPSCGFALDDCTADIYMGYGATSGLANATYSSAANSVRGYDAVNNQSNIFNKGTNARNLMFNNDINPSSASVQTTILGSASMKTAGRSNISSASLGSNTQGAYLYTGFFMATIRIKDLFDIGDFPMTKNLRGFMYLSFNSTQIKLTGTAGSTTISNVNITPLSGRTTPILLNTGNGGIVVGNYPATAPVLNITASVDATTTGALTNAGPLLTNARLLLPAYVANPKADEALTKSDKFFTTLEKIINPVTASAGSTVNFTITTGVPNPRKLVLLPMWQNLGGASNLTNPENSCFDTVPATSGIFSVLSNFQVYLANKPMYQYPIQYTYEQWVEENAQLGLNGGLVNEDTSGLLTQQLFEQNHAFYTVDLSKRTISEDGASKSVQVTFTNPSSSFGMKVICIVFYEKQWMINTAQCKLSQI
jgi:hypothetical protein